MSNTASKTGSRKTTIVLSAILVLLVLFALIYFRAVPAYRHYYVTHIEYPVYGGMTKELKEGELFSDLQSGKTFCFLGDSITDGTETNGLPWYQALIPYIKGGHSRLSCGGWMVHHLIEQSENIPVSDIYVVAIGINDVIFPWGKYASQTPEEYVSRIEKLTGIILERSPGAKIYFVAPWTFTGDYVQYEERGGQFRSALISWCDEKGHVCINPDPVISQVLKDTGIKDFMKDDIHPNAPDGICLYSYAVLKADLDRKSVSKQQD